MTKVKDLYIGLKLEDLEQYSTIPDRTSTMKTSRLLDSAKKLFLEAEKFFKEGDEEKAYICYMRYFKLLNCIHKKPDYAIHKLSVKQTLGGNDKNKQTMDKLESLTNSLNGRYNRQQQQQQKHLVAPLTKVNDDYVLAREYHELSASEKFDRVKAGSTLNSSSSETSLIADLNVITCEELFDRTKENNVLIMDCRPSADYKVSHLTYGWAFNVPEEIIVAGMSAGKLQGKLDSSSKALWAARSVKDHIVLMDWNTKDGKPPENTPIGILLNILKNWDPDVTYRSPIKILKNGYEYFIMMYPTLCTNPSVQAPQQIISNSDLIEDVEYPSIHDITMKEEVGYSMNTNNHSSIGNAASYSVAPYTTRPSIDRASKTAAIKTYDDKQKAFTDILKEHENLMEKAQANDKRLEKASKQWDTIFDLKKVNKKDLTAAEKEILYDILQLESAAEDYKIENNRLRDELNRYKRQEQEQKEKLTQDEMKDIEEAAKKIDAIYQERQRMDEMHEREKQQRERQLALARETKKRLKSPMVLHDDDDDIDDDNDDNFNDNVIRDDEELMPKTKIPQFDRSVKPSQQTIATTMTTIYTPQQKDQQPSSSRRERIRDFSPVPGTVGRGLTGLKNLGNTCYMNSILQCLSNTPQLMEYCVTDKYKNYISRNNKTRGQIVEEVAALIKVLWNGNYKCVASKDLRFVIGQYQQIFRGIEQQDSHEFLTILMDWLHSDLQTLPVPERPRDTISAAEKSWLDFTKGKESLILHLFYGQIKSTVKCVDCNKESATYESFSNLSLELPPNSSVCYLQQCMDLYFSGELIHGWNCPNCNQKRRAVKKLDISKLPPVLVIHLKRFYVDTDANGNSYKKKQTFVKFPLEDLTMTPYITRSELRSSNPKTYQLYGVSNHYGSMESGHYTAFCKSGNFGRWFKFDDQVVTQYDATNVVSSAGYILFYTWLPPIQITDNN